MDPNASRVIEELVGVISDVEQRLQFVKIGLAQAFPHLAPALGGRTTSLPAFGQIPFGMMGGAPPVGMQGQPNPYLAQQLGLGFAPQFGIPPGVTPPFGYPGAAASFRTWW